MSGNKKAISDFNYTCIQKGKPYRSVIKLQFEDRKPELYFMFTTDKREIGT